MGLVQTKTQPTQQQLGLLPPSVGFGAFCLFLGLAGQWRGEETDLLIVAVAAGLVSPLGLEHFRIWFCLSVSCI